MYHFFFKLAFSLNKETFLRINAISIDIKTFSECHKVFSEYENASLNKIQFSLNIKA